MAYLPGVPDVGPAPVSPVGPTLKSPGAVTSIGKPSGIAALAHSVGKPGSTQHLGTVVGRPIRGLGQITGGSPVAHAFNQFGKHPPALMGGERLTGGVDPTAHAGAKVVRGGNMRQHLRTGGLATEQPMTEDSE